VVSDGDEPAGSKVRLDELAFDSHLGQPSWSLPGGAVWTSEDQRRASEVANFVAATSLIAALAALILAYQAWTRPVPADPTKIPTWGAPAEPRVVDTPETALAFFDFLEENAGRKVRIFLDLDADYFGLPDAPWAPSESGFSIPISANHYTTSDRGACPNYQIDEISKALGDQNCVIGNLSIEDVGGDRIGLFYEKGNWRLRGYFADIGFIGIFTATAAYTVTPLTAIEAVS
jgi:hypothetical protein